MVRWTFTASLTLPVSLRLMSSCLASLRPGRAARAYHRASLSFRCLGQVGSDVPHGCFTGNLPAGLELRLSHVLDIWVGMQQCPGEGGILLVVSCELPVGGGWSDILLCYGYAIGDIAGAKVVSWLVDC